MFADFWRDVGDFRRRGMPTLLKLLFVRTELALVVIIVAAVGYNYHGNGLQISLVTLFGVTLIKIYFVRFLVTHVTPLYFGTVAFGRFKHIARFGHYGLDSEAEFLLVPSAATFFLQPQ